MVSNYEYAKLKQSNFAVKLYDCNPIRALFDTGATCSCISYILFMKISDKLDVKRKTLQVHTASGTTLDPIVIVNMTKNIEEHNFKHNSITYTKLKQPSIIGLDFTLRYKLGVNWDTSGTL